MYKRKERNITQHKPLVRTLVPLSETEAAVQQSENVEAGNSMFVVRIRCRICCWKWCGGGGGERGWAKRVSIFLCFTKRKMSWFVCNQGAKTWNYLHVAFRRSWYFKFSSQLCYDSSARRWEKHFFPISEASKWVADPKYVSWALWHMFRFSILVWGTCLNWLFQIKLPTFHVDGLHFLLEHIVLIQTDAR